MDVGVESPEAGAAMEFPASDTPSSPSTPRLPRRLQRRLAEEGNKSPCTAEEIEAKLREADLRRQQYYRQLSSKARPKPRSPSHSSSNEDDLSQRLEAKLQAAEQKRLSILSKAQMRLARLDELRQAAKTGVEMRFEKEREELGTRVESRVQQAEANRMLMIKAYRQRRATLKERSYQSLLRRMAWESKYKECVRASIHEKRAAAERKRLGFLEAEKKKAQARMLQVQQVARSVSNQREIERQRISDQLEYRLQRAKRQRAEYLKHRGRLQNSVRVWNRVHKQADFLSRKLARCWRRFQRLRRTTLSLTQDYNAFKINENVKLMPFEQFAILIESPTALQALKALLDRFESRLKVSRAAAAASTNNSSSLDNIDHLLKRVVSPKKRPTPRNYARKRESKKVPSIREAARSPAKSSRYPVRVVLCAYMILGHPDAVFSGQGELENALAKSAEGFVQEFELLIKVILEGPIQNSDIVSDCAIPKCWTFRSQLAAFDSAWCSYLNCFVAWKVKDALLLEEDLVRAACQLELSMMQTCKMTPEGDSGALTHDMKAIQKQVTEDQKLLREKVQHLSGDAGLQRMECALSETRSKYFQAKDYGSPVGSPTMHILSPSLPSPSAGPPSIARADKRSKVEGIEKKNRIARSLFRKYDFLSPKGFISSAPRISSDGQFGSSVEKLVTENELIVNEFLHEQCHFDDSFSVTDEDQNEIKKQVRETMEKAFWDGIMESLKQDVPDYDRIVQLMREVRDDICEMAPQSWKQEIIEAIDIDIFSQVLKSGNLEVDYLGRILEYALVTLQKLSAPANENEMKAAHQKLLKELAEICEARDKSNYSHIIAMIKGLRFVLEQIQALKKEISKARIRIMEPLLKGPAGFDYLRKAFDNRYGSPSDAYNSLPLTVLWLSSVWSCKDQVWEEHKTSLSALTSSESSSQWLPPTTLRSGGSFVMKSNGSQMSSPISDVTNMTGNQQPECEGGGVDLSVRLGLLKLVSEIAGLTKEALPETFILNLSRLRAVQAQIQKIVVISASILICRQILLSEQLVANPTEMESIVSKCTEQLLELLDGVEGAGIEDIVEIISGFLEACDKILDTRKLQSRKVIMARMLARSLQAGDAVFERVSRAVYLAARGVVLGGSGPSGRNLAEMALRQVGAAMLTEKVVAAAEVLVVATTVSITVHGPWYKHLTENL